MSIFRAAKVNPSQAHNYVDSVQWLHYSSAMPIIQKFLNCAVFVNTRDHNPPHFHVRMSDGREVLVSIEDLDILSHNVSRREIKNALSWAAQNKDLLFAKFKEYNP